MYLVNILISGQFNVSEVACLETPCPNSNEDSDRCEYESSPESIAVHESLKTVISINQLVIYYDDE
jgi:hypothetical protein